MTVEKREIREEHGDWKEDGLTNYPEGQADPGDSETEALFYQLLSDRKSLPRVLSFFLCSSIFQFLSFLVNLSWSVSSFLLLSSLPNTVLMYLHVFDTFGFPSFVSSNMNGNRLLWFSLHFCTAIFASNCQDKFTPTFVKTRTGDKEKSNIRSVKNWSGIDHYGVYIIVLYCLLSNISLSSQPGYSHISYTVCRMEVGETADQSELRRWE